MRVKIADTWYDVGVGRPIMVELTPADRRNIGNMAEDATKYAIFDNADETTAAEKYDWMGR